MCIRLFKVVEYFFSSPPLLLSSFFSKFSNASFGTLYTYVTAWVWVDEGNVGAGCCVGRLCLLFGRLLRGMMVSSWLVEGGGTKDVFVKEIVPGDLLRNGGRF